MCSNATLVDMDTHLHLVQDVVLLCTSIRVAFCEDYVPVLVFVFVPAYMLYFSLVFFRASSVKQMLSFAT